VIVASKSSQSADFVDLWGEINDQNKDLQLKYYHISQDLEDTKRKVTEQQFNGRRESKSYDDPAVLVDPDGSETDQARPWEGQSTQNEGGFTKDFDEQEVGNRRLGELPLEG
jgi:hypothetical protein